MMALTGIGLLGYVLVHMIGNLKIFIGPEDLDHYAESLRTLLYPIFPKEGVLWLFRIGLSGDGDHPHLVGDGPGAQEPQGPGQHPVREASGSTQPPTTRVARCSGVACSSPCSCSTTSPT